MGQMRKRGKVRDEKRKKGRQKGKLEKGKRRMGELSDCDANLRMTIPVTF